MQALKFEHFARPTDRSHAQSQYLSKLTNPAERFLQNRSKMSPLLALLRSKVDTRQLS